MRRRPKAAGPDTMRGGGVKEMLSDVAYQRVQLVNVAYVGTQRAREWVLVDAGVPGSGRAILDAVETRFGCPPIAIVLTHAHFDHVGVLRALAENWNVPIYAHPNECPFLDGTRAYPPPDPAVRDGLMSVLHAFCLHDRVNVSRWLRALDADGRIPPLPEWRWVHTPGHTAGHVSLWRARDRTLLAGDALITSTQDCAYTAADPKADLHGPPLYYTEDWTLAKASVRQLAALRPDMLVSGHGRAFRGAWMRARLDALARDFDALAAPAAHLETSPVLMPVRR